MSEFCSDCPPPGYATDRTRCAECPRAIPGELLAAACDRFAAAAKGIGEAAKKVRTIMDAASPPDPATTIAALRADLAAKDAEIARLREAYEIMKRASYQNHSGHWDRTGAHGAGCPECIRARELRCEADAILTKGPTNAQ